jgi:GPH family glycoside/pentoside/hexuronide:cation symporter
MQNGNDGAESGGKLRLGVHLSYGVSQFGLNAIGTAFGINALFFYYTEFGFSTALFGVIMLIGRLWDAVSDPMMGYLSDTTNWRRGRRRPFLPIGGISFGIAFLLVFSPPDLGGSQTALFAYILVFTVLMFTGRTVFETPYLALAPEMTQDYNERTKLSGYKQFLGTLGDAVGAMLPLVMLEIWFVGQRRAVHFKYGLFACVVMIVFGEITRRGTFENSNLAKKTQVGIIESFKAVAKNKPYLIFIFSSTTAQMGNNIVTFLVLFMTEYWFLDESLALWFFASFFIGASLSAPIWVFISNRVGKKPAYIFALVGYGCLLSSIMLFARDAITPIKVIMFFAGFFNVGLWVLAGTIQPDIIEWDQYHTGKRREGVYAGVWTFVYKSGIGLTLAVLGIALGKIGLNKELPTQTEETLLGLRLLFGPASAILMFSAAAAFFFYPITRRRHEEIRRLIKERKEAEEAEI